jgi:hypothetical protein
MRLAVLALVAACANAHPEAPGLTLAPAALVLAAGESGTVTATSAGDLASIEWSIDAPDVATVTGAPDGTATIVAHAPGHATASALLGVVAASVDVTVQAATIDRIDVTAAQPMVPKGTTTQLAAMAHYTDQHVVDVTGMATWSSSDASVATIDARGVLSGKTAGAIDAMATLGATTGKAHVMVTSAALVAIAIDDAAPGAVPAGLDHALTAKGTFTDGTMADVTPVATWMSSNSATATVAAGVVHAVAIGTVAITAAMGTVSATRMLDVAAPIVTSIALAPGTVALALGRDQPLVATGTYSDGTMGDVTAAVTWSATGSAATVSTGGLVHAAAQGTSTITAAIDQAMNSVVATIGPAVPDYVAIAPGDVTLAQHQRVHLHASVVYSDATTQDATATATWSSDSAIATIAAGTLDAQATAGTATITASASGLSAQIHATVGATACHVVINELQTAGAASADEWAELYNPCTTAIDVTGWTLDYRSSGNTTPSDNNLLSTLAGTMQPGDFRIYAGLGYTGTTDGTWGGGASGLLSGTAGGVGLRSGPKDTGALVDAVAYGSVVASFPFTEGSAAAAPGASKSIGRGFDGDDTNTNAADFVTIAAPTPRAANVP